MEDNLLETTCIDDDRRVFIIGIGTDFDDLSNEGKRLVYESRCYRNKQATERNKLLLNDLLILSKYLKPFNWLLPKNIKTIIEKYAD